MEQRRYIEKTLTSREGTVGTRTHDEERLCLVLYPEVTRCRKYNYFFLKPQLYTPCGPVVPKLCIIRLAPIFARSLHAPVLFPPRCPSRTVSSICQRARDRDVDGHGELRRTRFLDLRLSLSLEILVRHRV